MAYGSLFERLNGEATQRRCVSFEASVIASVTNHLAKMLSVRNGSVKALGDYGVPDINDMRFGFHDALTGFTKGVEKFIEHYEPRLSSVSVELQPDVSQVLKMSINIDGVLEFEGVRRQVAFTAVLDERCEVFLRQ